jgi:hypothetical protein
MALLAKNGRLLSRGGVFFSQIPPYSDAITEIIDTDAFYYRAAVGASVIRDIDGTGFESDIDDPVGFVRDLSGNGYHQSAATSGARAQLKLVSGGRRIRFDGVSSLLRHVGSFPLSAPYTDIICVARGATIAGFQVGLVVSQANAGDRAWFGAEGTGRVRARTEFASTSKAQVQTGVTNNTFIAGSAPHILTATCEQVAGNLRLRAEGSSALDQSIASNWTGTEVATSTTVFLGPDVATASADLDFIGRLRINRILTSGELDIVWGVFRGDAGL